MNLALILSMTSFALVASISPGPVNFITLSAAVNFNLNVALRHVLGATVGFTVLLILVGLSLHELTFYAPSISQILQWCGVGFLLYMAYRMLTAQVSVNTEHTAKAPTFLSGALLQWLNPKAWIAALSGVSAFTVNQPAQAMWWFAVIYIVVCFLSLACWAYAGVFLSRYLQQPVYLRVFNISMALLLVISAIYLIMH